MSQNTNQNMSQYVNAIANRLSLRHPQRRSLLNS